MTSRIQEIIRKLRRQARTMAGYWTSFAIVCLMLARAAMASAAQDRQPSSPVFTLLYTFAGYYPTNGTGPSALIQATNGLLYGTAGGGTYGGGIVFEMTPGGKLTILYNFCTENSCADGEGPGTLIQATDGSLYGTTGSGGAYGYGTVFKITLDGVLTNLHNFDFTDGSEPAGLVQAADGNLYGMTFLGGAFESGTVFKITPSGTLTTLYSFSFENGDGVYPGGPLVQASNGDLYGSTQGGGTSGLGTLFEITPGGTLTTLHSFSGADGASPEGALIQATDGNLYGITPAFGAYGYGTVFKMTLSGTLTTIYNFCALSGCSDGAQPYAGLVQATDGNFYGTTELGGANQVCYFGSYTCGTLYSITPDGVLTVLHRFDYSDGQFPLTALTQDTNGVLYGTVNEGGDSGCESGLGCGTIFSLAVGLGRFVETLPTSGKVGSLVKILGSNLAGTTSVSFNGRAAVFKVASQSLISAVVPSGATSGYVTVTTPAGTLQSNVKFRIRQ